MFQRSFEEDLYRFLQLLKRVDHKVVVLLPAKFVLTEQIIKANTDLERHSSAHTTLSGLPKELLAIVIRNLDTVSRACLALTSKPMA
jgi:hypothetical protein